MRIVTLISIYLILCNKIFSQSSAGTNPWEVDKYIWGYAQENQKPQSKPAIDFEAIADWQSLGDYLNVSKDGGYIVYNVERRNRRTGNSDSLIIQSTTPGWRYVVSGMRPFGFFAANGKEYIFQKADSLFFLQLGTGNLKTIPNIGSYKTASGNEWMTYQLKADSSVRLLNTLTKNTKTFLHVQHYGFDNSINWFVSQSITPAKELIIYNLKQGLEQRFANVETYTFSASGNRLVLNTGNKLQYVNTIGGSNQTIYNIQRPEEKISELQFDPSGNGVMFTVNSSVNGKPLNTIWYFKQGVPTAILKVGNQNLDVNDGVEIQSASFSDNGNYIKVLYSAGIDVLKSGTTTASLDIWSYKDFLSQSVQSERVKNGVQFVAIIGVNDGKVKCSNRENERVLEINGDYAIINKNNSKGDRFWDNAEDSNWVVSLKDGRRYILPLTSRSINYWFSPSGRYLVYYDPKQSCNFFSYDLLNKSSVNISSAIPRKELGYVNLGRRPNRLTERPYGLAAWLVNDAGLLVYDKHDIWQLDLAGKKSPRLLTNGYGRSNDIIFNLMNSERLGRSIPIIKEIFPLLLRAFDTRNKTAGFYETISGTNPRRLEMDRHFMHRMAPIHDLSLINKGQPILKAENADKWIVQRQSFADAPNYFLTKDFKLYERLTNVQPHQGRRWLTKELHTFSHLDGKKGQGILYKPEDFDPSKQYPVLIVFYGSYSNGMHQFPALSYNVSAITPGVSPAWFVNNGYLVFTPDIYVEPIKYGPQAFNVIEGAANYLSTLSFVDKNGLGCASHSWSAKLGTYLFTHSKSFAATTISEGYLYGNMINVALSMDGNGRSALDNVENVFHFGKLWENKQAWIDQTTVLNVDKTTCPLLFYCGNYEKSHEYLNQTQQLYNALWRLEKKAWWLKYDKGDHNLSDIDEQRDYTVRYTQFFDHYLKRAPAPRWMTKGVPYALRGVEQRFELDPFGTCDLPNKKECHICAAWNKQYARTPGMFEKEIKDWELDKDIKAELDKKQSEERKRLDAAGAVETKRILNILKHGYPAEGSDRSVGKDKKKQKTSK